MEPQSFTITTQGISNVLKSPCLIRPDFKPTGNMAPSQVPKGKEYMAIWDTGATGSVITKKVAQDLGLQIVSWATVNHAGGQSENVPVYRVTIELPNHVGFVGIKAHEGEIAAADVLIGMDIISRGDFAVTNKDGKTTFSFRVPSTQTIDFVPHKPAPIVKGKEPGRNDLCPCGSGKKYKYCCGANKG